MWLINTYKYRYLAIYIYIYIYLYTNYILIVFHFFDMLINNEKRIKISIIIINDDLLIFIEKKILKFFPILGLVDVDFFLFILISRFVLVFIEIRVHDYIINYICCCCCVVTIFFCFIWICL